MKIQIMSRNKAEQFVKGNPDHPIIAIGEPTSEDVQRVTKNSKNCLCLLFHDIEMPRGGYTVVQKNHVEEAVAWAKDKEDLVVACRAGVSRSSAMAYIIMCSKYDPKEAIKVLDVDTHAPNQHVVKLGSEVLENKEVFNVYLRWLGEVYNSLM